MEKNRLEPSRVFIALLVFICSATMAFAQFNAAIQGTVTDSSGAAVGGASITVSSQETSKAQTVTTDTSGFYRVAGLAPGKYTVSAAFSGFKDETVNDVVVNAEAVQAVNLTLQPGGMKETVTVSATALPQLQTENGNSADELTKVQVESLPQAGRDPYELVRLAPGVFGDGSRAGNGNAIGLGNLPGSPGGSNTSIFQTENQVQVSSNGQRVSDNNFLIDGVSVNSLGYGGAAVVTPNQESVKEIKVTTNAYDSQYGRNSGATVEVVSQNGTNRFHGSGFFKYDEPGLNAFNKYGGPSGQSPVRVQNAFRNFGGSLGGPIKKEKAFFFFSWEGLRDNSNATSTGTYVETAQYRQSVIAARPNSITTKIFQSPGIAPRIAQVLTPSCAGFGAGDCQIVSGGLDLGSITGAQGQYVDFVNDPTGGGLDGVPDAQFVTLSAPGHTTGNQYNGRVDFNLTSVDTIAVSTYFTKLNTLGAQIGSDARPDADIAFNPLNSAATVTWNRILSPTLLNQARLNFTRFHDNGVLDAASTNFGIPNVGVESYPFSHPFIGAPWAETTPAIFAQNTIELRDTLNKVMGNQGLKFGIEIRKEQDNNSLVGGSRPLYSFSGFWNLANDTPITSKLIPTPGRADPASPRSTSVPATGRCLARTIGRCGPTLP